MQTLTIVVLSYLLGSLSFSYWVVRGLKRIDVRTIGSGNAGATNVLRAAGTGPALLVLSLDVLKGAAAVIVARLLGAGPSIVGLAATAVVLGHVYPVFSSFKGGKGAATAGGVFLAFSPAVCLGVLVVFLIIVATTRYVSLASMIAAMLFPATWWVAMRLGRLDSEPGQGWLVLHASLIALLIIAKHRDNVARLWQGRENKFAR